MSKKDKNNKNFIITSAALGALLYFPASLSIADSSMGTLVNPSSAANPNYSNALQNIENTESNTNNVISNNMMTVLNNINTNISTANNNLQDLENYLNNPSFNFKTTYPAMGVLDLNNAFGTNSWDGSFDSLSVSAAPASAAVSSSSSSGSTSAPASPSNYQEWFLQAIASECSDPNSVLYQNSDATDNNSTPLITTSNNSGANNFNATSTAYALSTTCENNYAQNNANNIIPLVMPASSNLWSFASPNVALNNTQAKNLLNSDGSMNYGALNTQIQNLTPTAPAASTNSNSAFTAPAVQSYIDQLTATPKVAVAQSKVQLSNTMPELTLISGVLQAVAQDYQSGKMNNIAQAVSQENAQPSTSGAQGNPWQQAVASANVPDLLRMLLIEVAMSNQIQAAQLEQGQRTNVLLAATLADLVKLNQTNSAIVAAVNGSTTATQSNGQILNSLGNAIGRMGNK